MNVFKPAPSSSPLDPTTLRRRSPLDGMSWRWRGKGLGAVFGAVFGAILGAGLLAGCTGTPLVSSKTTMTVHSQSHPGRRLEGRFDHAIYGYDQKNNLTVVLVEGSLARPTQAVTLRMFWQPEGARTPLSAQATNATVQYVVFADSTPSTSADTAADTSADTATFPSPPPATERGQEEIGVYSGAGFFYPNSRVGQAKLRAGLWQATVRLTDRSSGFDDLLGKSILTGDLAARRDDAAVRTMIHRLSRMVTQRLGYPRLVRWFASPSIRPMPPPRLDARHPPVTRPSPAR